ncbi:MAG: putative peptidoglycan glycosyltransferase FtsW [Eubacteriales bacterium]|nr:putative peptidoglycan glycosyltransferase FtsW [Eubacteriales bacterium]
MREDFLKESNPGSNTEYLDGAWPENITDLEADVAEMSAEELPVSDREREALRAEARRRILSRTNDSVPELASRPLGKREVPEESEASVEPVPVEPVSRAARRRYGQRVHSSSRQRQIREKSVYTSSSTKSMRQRWDLGSHNALSTALLVIVIAMLCFGLLALYSASMTRSLSEGNQPTYYFSRQFVFTGIGVIFMFLVSIIDIDLFKNRYFGYVVYAFTLFLLLIVLHPSIGREVNSQRRWLPLPGIPRLGFQPSEIAKIATIFCLSLYFSEVRRLRRLGAFIAAHPHKQKWLDGFVDIFVPTMAIFLWCVLISLQSHMSAVTIILIMTFIIFCMNSLPWRSWFHGGLELLAAMTIFLVLVLVMRPLLPANFSQRWDHLARRINVFTDSNEATEADIYQTEQAEIAIGSGGLTGLGIGAGRQKFNYLPENHNDYIYSSIVEELGFIGGAALVVLFIAFLYVGLRISARAPTIFQFCLVGGFSFLICLQAILSVAVNVGAFPPTGISIPFFSYGGTANTVFLVTVGINLSIARHSSTPERIGGENIHVQA